MYYTNISSRFKKAPGDNPRKVPFVESPHLAGAGGEEGSEGGEEASEYDKEADLKEFERLDEMRWFLMVLLWCFSFVMVMFTGDLLFFLVMFF